MRGWAALRSLPLLLLLLPLRRGSPRPAGAEPSPSLPAPQDVEVYSYNFQSVLRWSPVPVENGSVLYTAQYRTGSYEEWSGMNCTQIPQTHCRFPSQLRRRRWTIVLRVRAELGRAASAWTLTAPFVAERNTTLGPARVNSVSVNPDSLLIRVSPPFTPETGDILQYQVSYWENTTSSTEKKLNESKTLVQIGNLKESTLYCFSIQVQLKIYSGHLLQGQPSAPECHRTALSEATQAVHIILLFLLGLIIINLLAAGLLFLWKYHPKIKHWAQPPLQIPAHFEEVCGTFGVSPGGAWGGTTKAVVAQQRQTSDISKTWLCCCDLSLLSSFAELTVLSCVLGHKPGCVFLEKPEPGSDLIPVPLSLLFSQTGAQWEQKGFVNRGLEPGLSRNQIWKSKPRLFLFNKP